LAGSFSKDLNGWVPSASAGRIAGTVREPNTSITLTAHTFQL
jgi:hypothetical protein